MVSQKWIKEAIYGVLFFAIVYGLASLTKNVWQLLVVLFSCTFVLYWFVYKIREISFYLKSFVYVSGMVSLFLLAGKAGIAAIIALHIIIPAWIIWNRRERIKAGYKEFEAAADKAFPPKQDVNKAIFEIEKDIKYEIQKKKKSTTPNKNKGKADKKRSTTGNKPKRTRKTGTVKKRSKDSTKKATNK